MVLQKVLGLMFKALDKIDEVKEKLDTYAKGSQRSQPRTKLKKPKMAKAINPTESVGMPKIKRAVKTRKAMSKASIVRSGKLILSSKADTVLQSVKSRNYWVVDANAQVAGKRSLAWILWALDAAESAEVKEGLSVHDMSSLLFHAANIETYPINLSRMVHDHSSLVQQVSQENKTKRYLLTENGKQELAKLKM